MLGNQLGREDFGERIQTLARFGMRLHNRAHGVGDFFAPTVTNGKVYLRLFSFCGRGLGGCKLIE